MMATTPSKASSDELLHHHTELPSSHAFLWCPHHHYHLSGKLLSRHPLIDWTPTCRKSHQVHFLYEQRSFLWPLSPFTSPNWSLNRFPSNQFTKYNSILAIQIWFSPIILMEEEVIAAIYAAIVVCSPTTNPPSLSISCCTLKKKSIVLIKINIYVQLIIELLFVYFHTMRLPIVLVHKCYNCKPCHLKVKAIGTRSYKLFV